MIVDDDASAFRSTVQNGHRRVDGTFWLLTYIW